MVLVVKNLAFFSTKALSSPITIPVIIEKVNRNIKDPSIVKGVPAVKVVSSPENSITVLKRIMQTASFVIPSPNTKLKSLGYSSYFITAIAATTSVQHRREHISMISVSERSNSS